MQSGSRSAAIPPPDPAPVAARLALTALEQEVLDFMVDYLLANSYQPSIREIGQYFEIKSTKTVSELLHSLAAKGVIERNPSRSRAVRFVGLDLGANTVSLPCFGTLKEALAGHFRGEGQGRVAIDRGLVGGSAGFVVRAAGSRLAAVGVEDGDLLLVRPVRIEELDDGDVVVAVLGRDIDFRRIAGSGGSVGLRTLWGEQEGGAPLGPGSPVVVGRVSALYRNLSTSPAAAPAVAH